MFEQEIKAITPRLIQMIEENEKDINGQFSGFMGLSLARVEAPQTRKIMTQRVANALEEGFNAFKTEQVVDGFYGMALQNEYYEGQEEIGRKISDILEKRFNRQPELYINFDQQI